MPKHQLLVILCFISTRRLPDRAGGVTPSRKVAEWQQGALWHTTPLHPEKTGVRRQRAAVGVLSGTVQSI